VKEATTAAARRVGPRSACLSLCWSGGWAGGRRAAKRAGEVTRQGELGQSVAFSVQPLRFRLFYLLGLKRRGTFWLGAVISTGAGRGQPSKRREDSLVSKKTRAETTSARCTLQVARVAGCCCRGPRRAAHRGFSFRFSFFSESTLPRPFD
jgi:hypothetical protein